MQENILLIIFVAYILWSEYKSNRTESQIKSLKKQNEDLIKENQVLIKKSRAGNFFVRLEKVDEDKRVLLTTIISILIDVDKDKAKSIVDVVRLDSMSIIVENVSEEHANEVRQAIENHGGKAVIVNKSLWYKIGADFSSPIFFDEIFFLQTVQFFFD